jgi:hypothetical protein
LVVCDISFFINFINETNPKQRHTFFLNDMSIEPDLRSGSIGTLGSPSAISGSTYLSPSQLLFTSSSNSGLSSPSKKTPVSLTGSNGLICGGHSFLLHAYVRTQKCDVCGDKLWGKEMRCEDCAMHVHSKCAAMVTVNCNGQRTGLVQGK